MRLKDAYNIRITKITPKLVTAAYAGKEKVDAAVPKLRWISKASKVECVLWEIGDLLADDVFNENSIRKRPGYAEGYAGELSDADIVQFEGYGLYKLDSKKGMRFLSL